MQQSKCKKQSTMSTAVSQLYVRSIFLFFDCISISSQKNAENRPNLPGIHSQEWLRIAIIPNVFVNISGQKVLLLFDFHPITT